MNQSIYALSLRTALTLMLVGSDTHCMEKATYDMDECDNHAMISERKELTPDFNNILMSLECALPEAVTSGAMSSDGKAVLIGYADGIAYLWDVETKKQLGVFQGHTASLYAVGFNHNGSIVFTASADGTACIWDVKRGEKLVTIEGHRVAMYSKAMDFNGSLGDLMTFLWLVVLLWNTSSTSYYSRQPNSRSRKTMDEKRTWRLHQFSSI